MNISKTLFLLFCLVFVSVSFAYDDDPFNIAKYFNEYLAIFLLGAVICVISIMGIVDRDTKGCLPLLTGIFLLIVGGFNTAEHFPIIFLTVIGGLIYLFAYLDYNKTK